MDNLYFVKATLGGGYGETVMACHVIAEDASQARLTAVKLYNEGLAAGVEHGLAPMPPLCKVHISATKSKASWSQAVNA